MSNRAATAAVFTAIMVTASVPSFRRAGHGFTDKGTAFHPDQLSDEQIVTIQNEKRLSVREVSSDAIPEGVDTSEMEYFIATRPVLDLSEEKKTQASKAGPGKASKATKSPQKKQAPTKEGVTENKDGAAENAGA